MQSYKEDKLIQTVIDTIPNLVEAMPLDAAHHVIGKLPPVGQEVTINGLVWVVEKVFVVTGRMTLRLKKY